MIDFKDLGIEQAPLEFTEEKISINDVLNKEIVVLGFRGNITTSNGDRHLMRVEVDGSIKVIFTGSRRIIDVLENERVKYPFKTTIVSFKAGSKRGFMFS